MMKYPNIEAERARHGMSCEQLAAQLGVSRKTIYNWSMSGNIPKSKLEKMADIFQCSTDYLLRVEIPEHNHSIENEVH